MSMTCRKVRNGAINVVKPLNLLKLIACNRHGEAGTFMTFSRSLKLCLHLVLTCPPVLSWAFGNVHR